MREYVCNFLSIDAISLVLHTADNPLFAVLIHRPPCNHSHMPIKFFLLYRGFGWVAQLVEQRIENPRVGGSIPSPATINPSQNHAILWLGSSVGRAAD